MTLLLFAILAQTAPQTESEVFVDRGETYVRGGLAQGYAKGSVIDLLAARERTPLGTAVVMEAWDGLARVYVDGTAASFKGPRVARLHVEDAASVSISVSAKLGPLDDQPLPRTPPTLPADVRLPAPAPTTAKGSLSGTVKVHGPGLAARRVLVFNGDGFDWHGCTIRLQDGRYYPLGELRAQQEDGVMLFRFLDGPADEAAPAGVQVSCVEGEGLFTVSL